MVDRVAIDESDPTSMRRVLELALGRYPARFAESAEAWASPVQSPVEPDPVSPSLSHAPHRRVA
jgi:hypothetical protein